MARLELDRVNVWLGGNHVLQDLSLTVEEGECIALLGPSGCGKTTTLRTVAGFIRPDGGDVRVGGASIARMAPNKRNVGIVFQDYALFPHMTVAENVAYGLEMRGVAKAEREGRVAEALDLVRLGDFGARYPQQLSGGQKQRVALARAIVIRPDILLLDEPLGALDRKLRDAMQVELKQLQRSLGITTIIVTHDQEEALSLSDRIAVMFDGRLHALDAPDRLYEAPDSARVMDFLGAVNTLSGTAEAAGDSIAIACDCGTRLSAHIEGLRPGRAVTLGIRPEHIALLPADAEAGENAVDAQVEEIVYKGAFADVIALTETGRRFHVRTEPARLADSGVKRDAAVRLHLPSRHLILVEAS
ncbi:MAG: ABC transporter ATP-binding protein [Alphaproteobacteria bacterium]|nr:ABC transporter ATP-binding protein [Alphaproteobacteria bacterium]MDX5368071.1 ABC transporter ATP-binding protein [Alphaproteobacteria bacterium]MDX5462910.1 ABC transporter ATP-binding protein [Alphaproteobacteria bacterium]